jgi:misacylated tRNA(Ala) deacylase
VLGVGMGLIMKKQIDSKMHSAEHILNQTMVRMFGCARSFNAHIEKRKSKCDYHFDRTLTEAEVREIERRVNEIIKADISITEEYITKDEAEKDYILDRLPEDVGDRIRIVRIGSYDACPCIGPHVDTTNQIGGFRITSASFENEVLRIRYKLDESAAR